ncbi:hypothetical protein LTR74_009074 [Friedmanniomyces endolithicus]|nr:hypothetical protein LTR74_009074 [Friedmanniomyces endolithicus]
MQPKPAHATRKRRREETPDVDDGASHATKKRQCREEKSTRRLAPSLYDSLSKVHLTQAALEEFDRRLRRNKAGTDAKSTTPPKRILRSSRRPRQLAKGGGPDLTFLRGYSSRDIRARGTMSQSSSQRRKRSAGSRSSLGGTSSATGSTRRSTPYDPNFDQAMIDGGVYPPGHRQMGGERPPKPQNIQELQAMLCAQRQSLSPSVFPEQAFEDFQDLNVQAKGEAAAMAEVIPVIAGQRDRQYRPARDVLYTNADPVVPGVSRPRPDVYYGVLPSQIDPHVRRDLAGQIVPSRRTDLPAAPNFSFEGKGASGRPDVAQRQAMNNGAYGARGMLGLQNYGNTSPVYDGNAYTVSATYHPGTGTMQMYTTHPVPADAQPAGTEYYMTQLRAFAMTDSADSFRQGAAAYRNARAWTQEQRDQFIANANAAAGTSTRNRYSSTSNSTRTTSTGSSIGLPPQAISDTSADELAGPVTPIKRPRHRRVQQPTS